MKRILISTLFSLTFVACGQEHTTVRAQPAEPNAVSYVFDGNYEVSGVSQDPNCAYDDTTWGIERTDDANTYSVDTATQVSYVHANRAQSSNNRLSWSEQRTYSFQGCDYRVVTTYLAALDADGNLTGTMHVNTVGAQDCVVQGSTCDFEIVSSRIK